MVAFVWLFTFMHVHMIPQMSYLSAGKLITFIWLLSTVIFGMYVGLGWVGGDYGSLLHNSMF